MIELSIFITSLFLISFKDLTRRILSYIMFIICCGLWMMKEVDKFFGYIIIWITISGLGIIYIQVVIGWGNKSQWPYSYSYLILLSVFLLYILKYDYKREKIIYYGRSLEYMIRTLFEIYWWYSIWIGLLLFIGMIGILRILRGCY